MKLPPELITKWIAKDSRVLDLGCGDGTLMKQLMAERQVSGYGVEIDEQQILACVKNGVNVVEKNLDCDLPSFASNSFDTVIMTQTLQAVHYPDKVLEETLRIGREGIITFPNFGFWKARFGLAFGGQMPVSKELPYNWYDTPNIHFCTVNDFEQLCATKGIKILEKYFMDSAQKSSQLATRWPNLFALTAVYKVTL